MKEKREQISKNFRTVEDHSGKFPEVSGYLIYPRFEIEGSKLEIKRGTDKKRPNKSLSLAKGIKWDT